MARATFTYVVYDETGLGVRSAVEAELELTPLPSAAPSERAETLARQAAALDNKEAYWLLTSLISRRAG